MSDENWPSNYFNYFTEVEEHFQRARGTALFLMSPLDWALVESWKNAGIPLAAVLRGIDAAFEKWRAKKNKTQAVNSITYCAQAVAQAAADLEKGGSATSAEATASSETNAPFPLADLESYFQKNIVDLEAAGYTGIAESLARIAAESGHWYANLEELEMRLSALEEKLIAEARTKQSEEQLFAARRELDLQLRPHRGKMTAGQLAMLERQFLERKLLESTNLPRLSLFYLR